MNMIRASHKQIGSNFYVGENTEIRCERFVVGNNCYIGDNVRITCKNFYAGDFLFIKDNAEVGHGGSLGQHSSLAMGDGCFIGERAVINTAHGIVMGDEVGIGDDVKLFTHGVYLNILDGFPSKFEGIVIGDQVWIQSMSHVMPGVVIDQDTVILAGSVVTQNIPAGSLVGGSPAKVLRENAYPKPMDKDEQCEVVHQLAIDWVNEYNFDKTTNRNTKDGHLKIVSAPYASESGKISIEFNTFNLTMDLDTRREYHVYGDGSIDITRQSEDFRDYLRRHGIRIMTERPFQSIKPRWIRDNE